MVQSEGLVEDDDYYKYIDYIVFGIYLYLSGRYNGEIKTTV